MLFLAVILVYYRPSPLFFNLFSRLVSYITCSFLLSSPVCLMIVKIFKFSLRITVVFVSIFLKYSSLLTCLVAGNLRILLEKKKFVASNLIFIYGQVLQHTFSYKIDITKQYCTVFFISRENSRFLYNLLNRIERKPKVSITRI